MSKDYYQVLKVPKNANAQEIKKAYRKLAMQYHPDRNPGKEEWANVKFKEINEAFSILGDPEKRKRYDKFGTAEGIDIGNIFSSPFTRGTFEDLMKDFGGAGLRFDFLNDIFGDFVGGKGASFSRRSGGRRGGRFGNRPGERINITEIFGRSPKSQTVRYELTLSPEEAILGTVKVLSRKGKRLEVKIPAAMRTGSIVKLNNALYVTDGRPGDILIEVKIKDGTRAKS